MAILDTAKNVARRMKSRSGPRLLTVSKAWHLTPNMIRVIFAGSELDGFPENCAGGNCKLLLPEPRETRENFAERLRSGSKLVKRTFTVRCFDAQKQELTIDFVAHGDNGPASRWANHAEAGSFLGFAGPSGPKVTHFEADWYLVAADPSAIPVAATALEAMPQDAKGIALFEVTTPEDRQEIRVPEGIDVRWIHHPNPHQPSTAQEDFIRALDWPNGRVQTCIAGESGVIRTLRNFIINEKKVAKPDAYISGYWKIGLMEDEHQRLKRKEG